MTFKDTEKNTKWSFAKTDTNGLVEEVREKVVFDLAEYDVVHPLDLGFVVVVNFYNNEEKDTIIKYCKDNEFEYTTWPRYIRLNQDAISIELKRLKAVEKHIKTKKKIYLKIMSFMII